MGERDLRPAAEEASYFKEPLPSTPSAEEEATREIGELYPFVISGGSNTERYYFAHINALTEYKFNIRPQYFGDESDYTQAFSKRIKEILANNADAKIFCVFDWDTIYENKTRLKKHEDFLQMFKHEIAQETVVICKSMPSIEYWFLLHFINHTGLLKNYGDVSNLLAPYLKPCFPNSKPKLKNLLKSEKYLKDSTWVENLCKEGKLEKATQQAEENIRLAEEDGDLDKQSYSYVYKLFK